MFQVRNCADVQSSIKEKASLLPFFVDIIKPITEEIPSSLIK